MTDSENVNEDLFVGQTFYIYPTRRGKEVRRLRRFIEKYGGFSVFYEDPEDKQLEKPHEGYALIDPSEVYAPRLLERKCQVDPDTQEPVLFYLNWGYPLLCVQADKMVEPKKARKLLTLNQLPYSEGGWKIFFSKLLQDEHPEKMERNLKRVNVFGGVIVDHEDEASIVITLDEQLSEERKRFEFNRFTRVESYSWLIDTLAQRYVKFTPLVIKGISGRPTADRRNGRPIQLFNQKEDRLLIKYLAYQSNPSGIGRQGNNIYKRLCESGDYPWAERHTWHSWRTRYKARKKWFDEEILEYIKEHVPPFADSHGVYPRTGTAGELSERAKFMKKNSNNRVVVSEDEDDQPPASQPTRNAMNKKEHSQESVHNPSERKKRAKATRQEQNVHDLPEGEQEQSPPRKARYAPPSRKKPTMDTNGSFETGVAHMPSSTPPRLSREREVSATQTTLVDPSTREPGPEQDQEHSLENPSQESINYATYELQDEADDEDAKGDEDHEDEEGDEEGDEESSEGSSEGSDGEDESSQANEDNEGGEDEEDVQEESPHEGSEGEEGGGIAPDAPPEGLSFLSGQLSAQEEAEVTRILDEGGAIPGSRRSLEESKEPKRPFELEVVGNSNIPAVQFVVGPPVLSAGITPQPKTVSRKNATPKTHVKAKDAVARNTRSRAQKL